jgi:putative oxidoreductase
MLPLAGRILMAVIFLVAGTRKIMAFAGTVGYMAKLGFPAPEVMTVLAIIVEVGGSILLIIGWRTRWVAWLLSLFVVIAALAAHRFWEVADAMQYGNQMNHFLKNVAIIGGLLFVAAFGPGSASVDKA